MNTAQFVVRAAIAATVLVGGVAHADRGVRIGGHVGFNHHYPAHGHVTGSLPHGSLSIAFGGRHHHYHRGTWYRPWGHRFMVSLPPLGIVVPLLPLGYATVWAGGAPYYYANGVYYAPAGYDGYRVVAPPPGAEDARVPEPKPAPDPIIYPRSGQSAQQTEADRQDCNRWATTQPSAMADASVFHRAVAACMDGRGYNLK